jgi:CSLREA domain-containing protein
MPARVALRRATRPTKPARCTCPARGPRALEQLAETRTAEYNAATSEPVPDIKEIPMSSSPDRTASTKDNAVIHRRDARRLVQIVLIAALAAILPLSLATAAPGPAVALPTVGPGSVIVVNSLDDLPDPNPGDGLCQTDANTCSLRAAIMEAESTAFPGQDTIDLSSLAGVITLEFGQLPDITEALIIKGPADASTLRIDADSASRHFRILSSASVEITRVHLTNGRAAESSGGSIYNGGSLTLSGVIITNSYADGDGGAIYGAAESSTIIQEGSQIGLPNQGNSAGYGGGVSTDASSLVIDNSDVSHNSASYDGGGVYNWSGDVSIQNQSVIEGNHAQIRGGGIYNNSGFYRFKDSTVSYDSTAGGLGFIRIGDSTVSYNSTAGDGGGMYNFYSQLMAVNTTISGNSAHGSGGGVVEESSDTLFFFNVTITDNNADADADGSGDGGGLVVGGSVSIINSILAGNADLSPSVEDTVHTDCTVWYSPYILGNSFNVVGDNSGCEDFFVDGDSGNQVGNAESPLDPVLSVLTTKYGGAPLHAILAGSPALDAGDIDGCRYDSDHPVTQDQRGMSRPQGVRCDAGAYEAAWPVIEDQFFSVPAFSPNGRLIGVVDASDPNAGELAGMTITAGNGTGDGAFALDPLDGELTVADSSQLIPAASFALTVVVANSIGLTDTATITVDVLIDPLIVTNTDDSGTGSLRSAITAANELPGVNTISFDIPGPGPHVILPETALPIIFREMTIDASTQPTGVVVLDGSLASDEIEVQGLEIATWGVTVRGLAIQNFSGNGIYWQQPARTPEDGPAQNLIENNVITGNGGNGVLIVDTAYVTVRSNSIYDNGLLGIDLDGDGVTPNDIGDGDNGANDLQNYPVLLRAIPDGAQTIVEGRFNSSALQDFDLEFYVSEVCDPSGFGEGQTLIGAASLATGEDGNDRFSVALPVALSDGRFITALATDEYGNTSEFSQCIVTGPGNDSWPRAFRMDLARSAGAQTATVNHYVDKLGQSRWYKFEVEPDSQVTVELGNLPANYDIVVYKDIAAVYEALIESAER